MKFNYLVLYLNDTKAAAKFWMDNFNYVIKETIDAGGFDILTIGSEDSDANFQLVPLKLMENNPNNLNLETPSICFYTDDLEKTHKKLQSQSVKVSDIMNHGGMNTFAFFDLENNAFAMVEK